MHLLSLELENIKCFERVSLSLGEAGAPRRWTFLVGPNGTGKSTLLKACAAAFVAADGSDGWSSGVRAPAEGWLRIGSSSGRVFAESVRDLAWGKRTGSGGETRGHALGNHPAAIFRSTWELARTNAGVFALTWSNPLARTANQPMTGASIVRDANAEGELILGFGPSRLATDPRKAGRGLSDRDDAAPSVRARRAALEPLYGLTPERLGDLFDWIRWEEFIALKHARNESHRPPVMAAIKEALDTLFAPLGARFAGVDTRGTMAFDTADGRIPIDEMADGVRSLFVIVAELLLRLDGAFPSSRAPTQEEAVCLIDEIDAHLHPSLQRTVVPAFRKLFPNVQFIVTTHSPYVVGCAQPGEVVVLQREAGAVTASSDVPDIRGWPADAIATSNIFGLDTTRDVSGEAALKTEKRLLGKKRLAPDEKRQLARAQTVLASADGPMTSMVRQLLAASATAPPPAPRKARAATRPTESRAQSRRRVK